MKIRQANSNDVPKLVKLWLTFMEEHDEIIFKQDHNLKKFEKRDDKAKVAKSYESFLQSQIKSNNGVVFIAEEKGKIIGYIFINIKDAIPIYKTKKLGHVLDLYVEKNFRNQSVASKLKNKAVKWFKSKKIKQISIFVSSGNSPAHLIYKKWGFIDYTLEMRKEI